MAHQRRSGKKVNGRKWDNMPSGGIMSVDPALTAYLKKKGQYGILKWNSHGVPMLKWKRRFARMTAAERKAFARLGAQARLGNKTSKKKKLPACTGSNGSKKQ